MKLKHLFLAALYTLALPFGLQAQDTTDKSAFVRTDGIHFYRGTSSEPYYFMGTNFWYGPILASQGQGGDITRLEAELDAMKELGINNLRILVGADAGSKNANTVQPYLQPEPGVLNDTLLQGLDHLLAEMQKREMVAVIYLTNSWDWSGGYGFYLRATGHGDSPNASGEGYHDYVRYSKDFYDDSLAVDLFHQHVRRVVSRTNTVTGLPYREDSTIMSWQLCNEPRPFALETETSFLKWVRETAALIKSLDPNHLVSTGSEGVIGCNVNESLCQAIHSDPNVDYMTVHIWPANWGWAPKDRLLDALDNVYSKAGEYIETHTRMAQQINKPYVIEEFGYPRDGNVHGASTPTLARDSFYRFVFSKLGESFEAQGPLAGCNFWGWGGTGRPASEVWKAGADYLCDPPHEPQGWYSVFDNDHSTLTLIKETAQKVNR